MRTLLQSLNFVNVNYNGRWHDFYNPPNTPVKKTTPKTKTKAQQPPPPSPTKVCKLRIRRRREHGDKGNCLLVFKRYGAGKMLNVNNPPCGAACLQRRGSSMGDDAPDRGCRICGMFVDIWVSDLESRVPSLCTSSEEDNDDSSNSIDDDSSTSRDEDSSSSVVDDSSSSADEMLLSGSES